MKNFEVKTSRTIFPKEGIKEFVIQNWALSKNCTVEFYDINYNEEYLIKSGKEEYMFKISSVKERTIYDIYAEIELAKHLASAGHLVHSPVAKKDGSYLTIIDCPEGERFVSLYTRTATKKAELTEENCPKFGRQLALFHLESKNLRPVKRFSYDLDKLLDRSIARLQNELPDNKKEHRYLKKFSKDLRGKIELLLAKETDAHGICHGNPVDAYLQVDSEGRAALPILDCFGYSWYIYDLATFWWESSEKEKWTKKEQEKGNKNFKAFLAGYQEVRALSENELKAIKILVPVMPIYGLAERFENSKYYSDDVGSYNLEWRTERVKKWVRCYWKE